MTLNLLSELLTRKKNKIARHCRVCVWNFSREVKLVSALPWQYFGNIWIYSEELLLPLVFRMSICLFFLCLLKKLYPFCSTILAGGASSSFSLAPTKTLNAAGDIEADHFDVPANTWDNLWHGDLVETLVMRASFLGFCFKLLVPTHWRWNLHHYHELGTERAISLI